MRALLIAMIVVGGTPASADRELCGPGAKPHGPTIDLDLKEEPPMASSRSASFRRQILTDTLAEALRVVGKSTRPAAPAEISRDRAACAHQLARFFRRSHVLAPADVVVPFVPCLKCSCLMLP